MGTKNVEIYVSSTGVHTNNVDMIPFYICCIIGECSSISFNHTLQGRSQDFQKGVSKILVAHLRHEDLGNQLYKFIACIHTCQVSNILPVVLFTLYC